MLGAKHIMASMRGRSALTGFYLKRCLRPLTMRMVARQTVWCFGYGVTGMRARKQVECMEDELTNGLYVGGNGYMDFRSTGQSTMPEVTS